MMLVYHRTIHADSIEREGFRDGSYGTPGIGELRGVFVSAEWPLNENEGADGDVVLELDVPDSLFAEYEIVEEGKPYREAMIPAARLNEHLTSLSRLSLDDEGALVRCGQPMPAGEAERWGFPSFVTCDLAHGHEGLHRGRWVGFDEAADVFANDFRWGD